MTRAFGLLAGMVLVACLLVVGDSVGVCRTEARLSSVAVDMPSCVVDTATS